MYFQLIYIRTSETLALVEMDEDLLKEIVNEENLTLNVKNGSQYTLIPIEDHKTEIVGRIKEVYDAIMEKPGGPISTYFGRYEELLNVVGLIFKKVKYYQITNASDLENLIKGTPPDFKEYSVF